MLTRFFGDSPLRVLVRLAFLSLVVGVIMAALGLEPMDLINNLIAFVQGLYNAGFETLMKAGRYFMIGAVIVVPIWLLSRLFKLVK